MNERCQKIRKIPTLPDRATEAHKGNFGRVLVLGGSVGMVGAPSLAGLAALRSGAGLVTLAIPESIQPVAATLCPCATTIPLPQTSTGQIDSQATRRVLEARGLLDKTAAGPLTAPDVLAVGPGIGAGSMQYGQKLWDLIDLFRNELRIPAVIDADALNLTSRTTRTRSNAWHRRPHFRTVITPHPGELARMQDVTTREIQADREGFAVRTAREMSQHRPRDASDENDDNAVVVLKGAGTVVTDGQRIYVNRTGNPGMATGGSGDVLTGMIASLIGQGMSCFEAAVAGAYLHGLAGDLAAKRIGPVSLIATDIIDALPEAIRSTSKPMRRPRPRPKNR